MTVHDDCAAIVVVVAAAAEETTIGADEVKVGDGIGLGGEIEGGIRAGAVEAPKPIRADRVIIRAKDNSGSGDIDASVQVIGGDNASRAVQRKCVSDRAVGAVEDIG